MNNAEKVRVYMDQDSGIRAAFMSAFADRIKDRTADGWYVSVQKGSTVVEKERAVQFAKQAMQVDPDDPMLLYNVACTYAQLDMLDDALTALEHAVEGGWGDKNWIEHDSDLDSLRDTPRYKAIVKAM